METLANKEVIESSSLFLDLSHSLLNKLDIFLSNSDLTKKQQKELIDIMELTFSEGYTSCMTD